MAAQSFLTPDAPGRVVLVQGAKGQRKVQIALHGLLETSAEAGSGNELLSAIGADLARRCPGSSNLVFANSRQNVEDLASRLSAIASDQGLENPFLVHHASLSRELREQVEARLKSGEPVTALCTSTLELGIDLGSVKTVFQVDPPPSVSALLQRLGRSGRRSGDSAILRLYTRDRAVGEGLSSQLYPELLRGIAVVELMLKGWLEPQEPGELHLSTLIHQVLSLLKQTGGATALDLHRILCKTGPFDRVTPDLFKEMLHDIAKRNLIEQDPGGELILGLAGERIVNAPSFYAAFQTQAEFTVRFQGRTIGRISSRGKVETGSYLGLAGQKWTVERIDERRRVIDVRPSSKGNAQTFEGQTSDVHTEIYRQMRELLLSDRVPNYLDGHSCEMLGRARAAARELGLTKSNVLVSGKRVHWFPWLGTRGRLTLALLAKQSRLPLPEESLCLCIETSPEQFREFLQKIVDLAVEPTDLAGLLKDKLRERFDSFLGERLVDLANADRMLALGEAVEAATDALHQLQRNEEGG